SVTSLKVVLADGSIVETGTASTRGAKPFWRHYGPDLTGVFMGDAGALGFKVEATFRLIQAPSHEDWASFEFATLDGVAKAAADMARTGIACELFGFDPNLTKVRLKRASLAADVKTLKNVVAGQGSLLKGVKEGAKIALAGRSFMADAAYSLHAIVEGRSKAGVADGMAELKSIAEKHGAREIENSIPKIIRANPFTPLNNMLGPEGERWAPVHGIISMSDGPACWARIDALFETLRDELDAHNILTGYLVTTLSTNGYLIEPVFIWPEELFDIHERSVEKDFLARLPRHKSNPDATALVAKVRSAVVDVFAEFGGAHFQIGKTYPYRESRTAAAWALVEALKSHVDAKRVINPGALGLK
ncbi:MAG: FAD-binding oxidoreductase, partial [Pseudomonadota bacterium]